MMPERHYAPTSLLVCILARELS